MFECMSKYEEIKPKGFTGIEINGLRFSSFIEMVRWIGNAQDEIKELKAELQHYADVSNCAVQELEGIMTEGEPVEVAHIECDKLLKSEKGFSVMERM